MTRGNLVQIQNLKNSGELPLITIVVTVYNIKDYLKRSIESVMQQSYKNLEIILVDDGSTDGSGEFCDRYAKRDGRIKVIHKKNGGPAEARNVAIEEAKGEYIAFVDGDDWIEKDMYENMYLALKAYNSELAICSYKEVSETHIQDHTDETVIFFQDDEALESFIREEDEVRIQNAAWNKLYKKELLENLRFPVGKLYEEIVFTTKLLHKARGVVYLNQGYYNYVTDRAGSIMNMGVNTRIFTDQIPLYQEKRAYLESIGRNDLVSIHNFYFYKRLLLHYLQLQKHRPDKYKDFCRQIRNIVKKEKKYIAEAYCCDVSSKNEAVKMNIFRISPRLFCKFTMINEKYVIPQKQVLLSKDDPLVVIQLSGGMGNQMFQYALYMQLKALGKKVKIDDKTDYAAGDRRPIRLNIFGLKYETPSELEMLCLTDSFLDVVSKIRRRLTGRKTAEYIEKSQLFDKAVFNIDRAYLVGCWQSEKYFMGVKNDVKKAFSFTTLELSSEMKLYEKKIRSSNSVCMHIRRGDYLAVSEVYGDICTPEYYSKAMKQMKEWEPDCHFFIFTNDVIWAKGNYQGEDITIVEGNSEDAGYIDLYLMTRCRHYILANSSFSWWGCYLGSFPGKRVIAPRKWFNNKDCSDIYTEEMKTRI